MVGYIVRVFLYKCTGLPAADAGIAGGKSDPYVTFAIGKKQQQSTRLNNTLDPEWSPPERFEFVLPKWQNQFVQVQVLDHDHFSRDDLIGSAIVPLGLFVGQRHQGLNRFPLVQPDEFANQHTSSDIYLQVTISTLDGKPA